MLRAVAVVLLAGCVSAAVDPIKGLQCAKNQVINRLTVFEDGALEAECGQIPCGEAGRRCIDDQTSCRADTDVFSGMRWAANGQSLLLRCCTLKSSNKIYVGTDLVSAGSYYVGGPVAQKDLYGSGGAEYDFIANVRTEQGGVRVWVYRIMCAEGETREGSEESTEEMPSPSPAAPKITAAADSSRVQELEKRREELMKKLAEKEAATATKETSQEEEDEEEEEEEEEETTVEEQNDAPVEVATKAAEPFNPLRYRPSRIAARH